METGRLHYRPRHLSASLPWKMHDECLETDLLKHLNQTQRIHRAVFFHDVTLQTKFSVSNKFPRILGRMRKISVSVLWNSKKHVTTWSIAKLWGVLSEYRVDGCLLLAFKSFICAQKFEICVRVGGVQSLQLGVDVGHRQGCLLLPLLVPVHMNCADSHRRIDESAAVASCKVNGLHFANAFVLRLHLLNRVFNMHLIEYQLRAIKDQWKLAYMDVGGTASLQKPKAVYSVIEQQYTAAGQEVQVPRGGIHEWRKEIDTRIGKENIVLREPYRCVVTKRELSNATNFSFSCDMRFGRTSLRYQKAPRKIGETWLHTRESGPEVDQGTGGMTTSLTLHGCFLVRGQQNYQMLMKPWVVLSANLLPKQLPQKKNGCENE